MARDRAAGRSTRGRASGGARSRQTAVLDPETRLALEPVATLERLVEGAERREKRLGPHERAARHVEPMRHLTAIVRVRIRPSFAEAEIGGGDSLFTPAAAGASVRLIAQ